MDAYDFEDAVDISNQIPASFFTQIESKKWSERKEALEVIEKVTSVSKIAQADFNELIRVLKKVVAKDANIVVATLAAKCLYQLARGLRTNFAPYSNSCLSTFFEKFKEKKPNVVSVLRDAADAAFAGTNLENILEDVIAFLDNKNPQIKSELSLFLARTFSSYPAQVMNKKTLRPLINALIKALSDMDANVRDSAAMAIGTAMKVSGEKVMMTLIADVEAIKVAKIKEFCEKAEIKPVAHVEPIKVDDLFERPDVKKNSKPASQAPPAQNGLSRPRKSTATMVRSTSNRRLTTGSAPKPTTEPIPNATVKRNATIIKRSTAPKRSIVPPQQHMQQQQQQPPPQQQQHYPEIANNMGPPPPPATNILTTPVKPVFTNNIASKTCKHGLLDLIILRIISDSLDDVMSALVEIDEILADDTETDFKSKINQIIDLTTIQLVKSFDCLKSTSPNESNQASRRIQKIYELMRKILGRRALTSAANPSSIRFLLLQLFTLAQCCGNINDDGTIRKTLNNLSVVVMDSFEPANIMCILTGLLNEPTPSSIVSPVKDAIIRSMRSFE